MPSITFTKATALDVAADSSKRADYLAAAVDTYKGGRDRGTVAAALAMFALDSAGGFDKPRDADGRVVKGSQADYSRQSVADMFAVSLTTVDLWRALGQVLGRSTLDVSKSAHYETWQRLAFKSARVLSAEVKAVISEGREERKTITLTALRNAIAEADAKAAAKRGPQATADEKGEPDTDADGNVDARTEAEKAEAEAPLVFAKRLATALVEMFHTLSADEKAEVWAMVETLGDEPSGEVAA